jgi:hypothetical protein
VPIIESKSSHLDHAAKADAEIFPLLERLRVLSNSISSNRSRL